MIEAATRIAAYPDHAEESPTRHTRVVGIAITPSTLTGPQRTVRGREVVGASPMVQGVRPVGGRCDARFEAVRELFVANFDDGESGAACSIVVEGRTVVDLQGGGADASHSRPWQADTLGDAFSGGKPVAGSRPYRSSRPAIFASTMQRRGGGLSWSPVIGAQPYRRCSPACPRSANH